MRVRCTRAVQEKLLKPMCYLLYLCRVASLRFAELRGVALLHLRVRGLNGLTDKCGKVDSRHRLDDGVRAAACVVCNVVVVSARVSVALSVASLGFRRSERTERAKLNSERSRERWCS